MVDYTACWHQQIYTGGPCILIRYTQLYKLRRIDIKTSPSLTPHTYVIQPFPHPTYVHRRHTPYRQKEASTLRTYAFIHTQTHNKHAHKLHILGSWSSFYENFPLHVIPNILVLEILKQEETSTVHLKKHTWKVKDKYELEMYRNRNLFEKVNSHKIDIYRSGKAVEQVNIIWNKIDIYGIRKHFHRSKHKVPMCYKSK